MIESWRKTPVYLVRGRGQGSRRVPGFINGELPRPIRVNKLLFYWFDKAGDLQIAVVPVAQIEDKNFRLI